METHTCQYCAKSFTRVYNLNKHQKTARPCLKLQGIDIVDESSLLAKFPDICKEWDYGKNTQLPETYAPFSSKKVGWICATNDCHKWDAIIANRTKGHKCPFCSGKRVDNSELGRNLFTVHPNICKEWDYDKNNGQPEDYSPASNKKVWWKCQKNLCGCHVWEASINSRTSGGKGCPFCSRNRCCKHYNLETEHPEICKEWDYEKNQTCPNEYLPRSNKEVWWKCLKSGCKCHEWKSKISDRTSTDCNRNCPFCSGHKCCTHYNLETEHPEICKEWDYSKNLTSPGEYMPGSSKKIWWKCLHDFCGCHTWEATIYSRTSGSGCPFCSNNQCCEHYNFKTEYPKICKEWDYEKNKKRPEQYSPFSHKKVWWKCSQNSCGCHVWKSAISDRVRNGCPFCSNKSVCEHNNLLALCPNVCKEWDYSKNDIHPSQLAKGSGKCVWWICNQGHSWKTNVYHRTNKNPTGCPICCEKAYSKKQIEWLDQISCNYNIDIQHAEHGEEYALNYKNRVYRLDGFAMVNGKKIAFEFDGCYWHGCPNCYETGINVQCNKTFKQLYAKTLQKHQHIRDMGFELVVIKECEYDPDNCGDYDNILL